MSPAGQAPDSRRGATSQVASGTGSTPNQPPKEAVSACAHCGLPLPPGRPFGDYCCAGCRAVRAMLEGEGLDRFYDLGGGSGQPIGAVPAPSSKDWLPELEERGDAGDGVVRVSCDVQGIHCAACVWLMQELWQRTPGAVKLDLNPALGRAEFAYRKDSETLPHWIDAVENLGYRVGPVGKSERQGERGLLIRLGICTALALNAMMFAFADYFGMTASDGAIFTMFRALAFGFSTGAVLIGGPVFFRAAIGSLRRGVLHLDLPISIGILLAWGSSTWSFFTGQGIGYFDTVTVFVALMLLGRYLQRSAISRNRDYLLANDGTEHVRVKRLRVGGEIERAPVKSLQPGDMLLIAPGDLVPVDARLCDAAASFSLDWISGESRPRSFEPGDEIPAGAFLGARSAVRVAVIRDATDSGLTQLLSTPPVAADEMRGRGRFWQLLNRGYVTGVLLVAALVAGLWLWIDPSRAVEVTTAVLVVTCPCALGLAMPLAFDLALARLRRLGVFVRDPNLLEKARHVRKVIFDKTGTLTWGGVRTDVLQEAPLELRDVLFTMASSSNHPVSRALSEELGEQGARFDVRLEVEERVGEGMLARFDGAELRFGSPAFTLTGGDRAKVGEAGLVLLTRDGETIGAWEVREDYRSGAGDEIHDLIAAGYQPHLLSGDRPDRVEAAARDLGFAPENVMGGCEPQAKAERIAVLDEADTMMVGDGLNDAPAFEAAYCAGTPALDRPVLPSRADFFYTGVGTGVVARVLGTARRFHTVVAVNLGLAVLYNLIAVSLAASGVMTPLLCALLMPLSSLVLIGHTVLAMRAVTEGGPK